MSRMCWEAGSRSDDDLATVDYFREQAPYSQYSGMTKRFAEVRLELRGKRQARGESLSQTCRVKGTVGILGNLLMIVAANWDGMLKAGGGTFWMLIGLMLKRPHLPNAFPQCKCLLWIDVRADVYDSTVRRSASLRFVHGQFGKTNSG